MRYRKYLLPYVMTAALLALGGGKALAQGTLLTHVDIDEFTISPDGDGVQDSLVVSLTIADSALSVTVLVLKTDSSLSPVDSLIAGIPLGAGIHEVSWNGEDFLGTTVPQDSYYVFVNAVNATSNDTVFKTVHVDLTPPQVSITRVEPGVFAPDIPSQPPVLYVYFDVWNSPRQDADQARVFIDDPSGNQLVEIAVDSSFTGDGSYRVGWNGAEAVDDGTYNLRVVVSDNGGHSTSDWTGINVDKKEPDMGITFPEEGADFQVVPPAGWGWAWDRNGVNPDSLLLSYSGTVYEPVDSFYLLSDTLFFTFSLADSMTEEKRYTLFFKARDIVGREKRVPLHVTYDRTAPAAPVLDQPAERVVHGPDYVLRGSIPSDAHEILVYRNGVLTDSTFLVLEGKLSLETTLVPGGNVFQARTVDKAGNFSAPSNTVEIVFDDASGLYMPEPFRANDAFQLNLARSAASVEMRIYDMGGDLVAVLGAEPTTLNVTMPWNGLNGGGESVLRGPLVAVAFIRYDDGAKESIRKIFLFSP